MVFKSDRQRKGFFANRGGTRSNINPNILTKSQAKTDLRKKLKGFVGKRFIIKEGTLVTAKGKKVKALFAGSRGGDLFGTAIKVNKGYVNAENQRNVPRKFKPFFPFKSVKKTPFVDLPFGKQKV